MPTTVSVDGWSVGRSPAAGDSAVRYQITDARSPMFPRCLDACNQQQVTDADQIGNGEGGGAMHLKQCLRSALARASKLLCWHWQCHPLGICQSAYCAAVTETHSV